LQEGKRGENSTGKTHCERGTSFEPVWKDISTNKEERGGKDARPIESKPNNGKKFCAYVEIESAIGCQGKKGIQC